MKKLMLLSSFCLVLVGCSNFSTESWTEIGNCACIRTFQVEGHSYIAIVQAQSGGAGVVHSESCICKAK